MARLVRHERTGPIKIEPQEKPVFICGCGLTGNFPYCDGSHKACAQEAPGKVYVYGPDKKAVETRADDAAR